MFRMLPQCEYMREYCDLWTRYPTPPLMYLKYHSFKYLHEWLQVTFQPDGGVCCVFLLFFIIIGVCRCVSVSDGVCALAIAHWCGSPIRRCATF